MHKQRVLLAIIFLCVTGLAARFDAQTTGKNPVIIIPGITGSQLINPADKRTVWFSVKRDKNDDIRLPIASPVLWRNKDSLVVGDIIRQVELPILPDVEVYEKLIEALIERGFTEADWKNPKASDVFYVFPYDWRRDNVETAEILMKRMAEVKRTLKAPRLKFDIIAHSMGGLIARYAAMYGTADLPREGVKPVPSWAGAAHINKLMMFGTPNEGSFSSFEVLLNGYPIIADRRLPFIDDLRVDDVFTIPSLFQLIPHQESARFLDENLEPKDVDIYDPETWLEYGWGALSDTKFLGKLKDAERLRRENSDIKPSPPDKNANADDRSIGATTYAQARAYFASALSRAKRFHLALDARSKSTPVQLFAYGGNCAQTLDAVVLVRDEKKGRWSTLLDARDIKTSAGREIKKDEVKTAMFAIGDGRVTKRSLLAETAPKNTSAADIQSVFNVTSSFFACGTHFKLFLEKPIQDSFLSALIVEQTKQP